MRTTARMARAGIAVPPFIAVTTAAYEAFLDATELCARILVELDRKDFADMRWEEMWDAALRIRSLFLRRRCRTSCARRWRSRVAARFADVATVVRSSAPGEDSAAASFAGLHESYVNVAASTRSSSTSSSSGPRCGPTPRCCTGASSASIRDAAPWPWSSRRSSPGNGPASPSVAIPRTRRRPWSRPCTA